MSLGCGTLANPENGEPHAKGTAKASSSNGKRHTLPANPVHTWVGGGAKLHSGKNDESKDDISGHWSAQQPKGPTRLWGKDKKTKMGGIELVDGEPTGWQKGEFWNVDSNIKMWGRHEILRNAAAANHDVHRHDQVLAPVWKPGSADKSDMKPRRVVSGVVSNDCSFLEAWGFDLGKRDRQGAPVRHWNPTGSCEMFRAPRSYDHDLAGIQENHRSMRRTASTPGQSPLLSTLKSGTLASTQLGGSSKMMLSSTGEVKHIGKTYGSKSCRGWDRADHAVKREAARLALSVHAKPETEIDLDARPMEIYRRTVREATLTEKKPRGRK